MILRILGRLKKSHQGFARKSDGGCKIGRMMRQVSGDFRIFFRDFWKAEEESGRLWLEKVMVGARLPE